MRSCEGIGKNLEQAIQNALFELKAAREDVDIKIISEGGFLKKAKVLVTISDDALEKYERKEALKREEEKEEKKAEEVTETETKTETEDTFVETFIKKKISMNEPNKIQIVVDEISEITPKEDIENDKKVDPKKFLEDVLKALDLEAEISVEEDDKFVRYILTGDNLNDLIGHHGECLFALSSYMTSVFRTGNKKKVVLDINNYRDRRAETLTALAKRVASKVAKSGRYYKFEPMNASERKVIHTTLQNDDRVTTMSKGEEPHRYLIVFPREYKED